MTTTTINRVAALHALADHIDQHDLADDITSISFDDVYWTGLIVHVHEPVTVAAWVRSLGDVKAFGRWYGTNVHLRITIGELAGVPVSLLFVAYSSRDRALLAGFRESVQDVDPGVDKLGWPITLPAALGGAA